MKSRFTYIAFLSLICTCHAPISTSKVEKVTAKHISKPATQSMLHHGSMTNTNAGSLLEQLEKEKPASKNIQAIIKLLKEHEALQEKLESLRSKLMEQGPEALADIHNLDLRQQFAHYMTEQFERIEHKLNNIQQSHNSTTQKKQAQKNKKPASHAPHHKKEHPASKSALHHEQSGALLTPQHIQPIKKKPNTSHPHAQSKSSQNQALQQLANFGHSDTKSQSKKLVGTNPATWGVHDPQSKKHDTQQHTKELVGTDPATWGPPINKNNLVVSSHHSISHPPAPTHQNKPTAQHTSHSPQQSPEKEILGKHGKGTARQALVDSANNHIGYYDVSDHTIMLHGKKYHMSFQHNTGSNPMQDNGKTLLGFIVEQNNNKVFYAAHSGWNGTAGMAIYGSPA